MHRMLRSRIASDVPLVRPELKRPFEADGEFGAEHRPQEDELLQRREQQPWWFQS